MRNLVVCLDGTWNTPDQKDRGRQVPSNVVKMARAVHEGQVSPKLNQQVYYDCGVGTGGWRDKWLGGATGQGITKNIMQAYAWLADVYQEDDRIFLFGFSRGAYTARSLAGILGLCGIPQTPVQLNEAKDIYRISDHDERLAKAADFKEHNNSRPGDVHFIGVWDTVGALGIPINPINRWLAGLTEFHDVTLGPHIRHAYHAVAINERRGPFKPTLWSPSGLAEEQTLVQAWFPGVHTNIGGGYVDSGLSDRAFLWMLGNAYRHGLRPDDKYVRLRVQPNWFGELRDSVGWKYKLMFWNPPRSRVIGVTHPVTEFLHMSAAGRWHHASTPESAPANFNAAHGTVPVAYASNWEKEFNRL